MLTAHRPNSYLSDKRDPSEKCQDKSYTHMSMKVPAYVCVFDSPLLHQTLTCASSRRILHAGIQAAFMSPRASKDFQRGRGRRGRRRRRRRGGGGGGGEQQQLPSAPGQIPTQPSNDRARQRDFSEATEGLVCISALSLSLSVSPIKPRLPSLASLASPHLAALGGEVGPTRVLLG